MANHLTISIDNKKYTVAAPNEDKVVQASNLLNNAISECKENFSRTNDFSVLDTITFAALNIADKEISNEVYYNEQINMIVNEINKISEYINNLLK